MKKMTDREHVTARFAQYAADYDPEDPKIKLKIGHTYRVAALAERIAESINSPVVPDKDLAWLCGMLHDIGRFEQVRRFGTFQDAVSVDHAMLGADILFKDGLIKEFCTEERYYRILELAIRSHSLYRIPEGLTDDEIMYCSILRDADKIDIFRVNCETPLEDIYNVSTDVLKNAGVTDEVRQCFDERHTVPRAYKKTPADNVVGHICLTFELVYPDSRSIAREQGYVDRLMSFKSDNPDTAAWFEHMRNNLWKAVQ